MSDKPKQPEVRRVTKREMISWLEGQFGYRVLEPHELEPCVLPDWWEAIIGKPEEPA